jgi:hypothetical protein
MFTKHGMKSVTFKAKGVEGLAQKGFVQASVDGDDLAGRLA